MNTLMGLVAVFALVFLNGFFVAAEFALVGARRTRIIQLASEGHVGARIADQAIEHLDNYIAATQLGITLASLGLGWIGEPAVAHLIEGAIDALLPHDLAETLGHGGAIAIAFAMVTMLHIVLGELAPKSIALQRPEGTAVIVARPTTWFLMVFRPVIYVMNAVGNGVVRLLGFEPAHGHEQVHSAEELEMLVHSSQEAGLLEKSEERLIQRVFDFSDIHVREVMRPRVEVQAIPVEMRLPDLLSFLAGQHFSRFPVFEGSIDHVVGVLHTKDLLDKVVHQPALLTGEGDPFSLRAVLRMPLFVPMTLTVDRVLEDMRRRQMHFAVVLDEFGGMAGVVTMEDIIEELVGEVQDEFDEELTPSRLDDDMPTLDGLESLNDVIERFGKPGGEPDSTTIGGYVAERLGRIPHKGDRVPFGRYEVVVEQMDGMRVTLVRFAPRPGAHSHDAPELADEPT